MSVIYKQYKKCSLSNQCLEIGQLDYRTQGGSDAVLKLRNNTI
jgi:hypothetical protein